MLVCVCITFSHVFFLCFQHAHALELLSAHLKKGNRALDVGSGSGYLTACMGHMVNSICNFFIGYIVTVVFSLLLQCVEKCERIVISYDLWMQ